MALQNEKSKLKHKLPRILLVVHRVESGADFFLADNDSDVFADGEVVGTYELKDVGIKQIRHSIEAE